MPTIGELLNTAIVSHQSGQYAEAERLYQMVLSNVPQHPDAWHLLGVLAYQTGKPAMAVEMINRAIGLQGNIAVYYANLGEAYRALNERAKAEIAFQRAIELDPNQADACNNYGLLLQSQGRVAESLVQLERAIAVRPNFPEAHNNLGMSLAHVGRDAEARTEYMIAARARPGYVAPLENLTRLALKLASERKFEEACAAFADIVSVDPGAYGALSNMGAMQFELQHYAEAADSCRRALQLRPEHIEAWNNLGSALLRLRKYEESEQALRQALVIKPNYPDALNNLGLVAMALDRFETAEEYFRRSLEADPQFVPGHLGLGLVAYRCGQYQASRGHYERALQLRPNDNDALNKLGTAIMALGQPDEAVSLFARCLELDPRSIVAHSNFLFCNQYLPDMSLQRLAELHREFERRHVAPLYEKQVPHERRPELDRRLRIGFVSADLRHHPIGFLLTEIFEHLDAIQFELACYSTRRGNDDTRNRLKRRTMLWRDIEMIEDGELANLIRSDAIDVLIDLTGHTSGGRLLTFARRPAPVQATWMGYPSTTGVSAIDYLISDRWMTPEGVEPYFAEKIMRMPEAAACYRPPADLPMLATPPSARQPYVTFGSFNNSAKINPRVVELWSQVLKLVPGSQILLKFRALHERGVQDRLAGWFAEQGVERNRIEFQTFSPLQEMLATYGRVDVALDTFPFSGGTTTMLALLMGVPVVTLPGETMASRQSLAVLKSFACDETIAANADDFVAKAVALANNSQRLNELRPWLREQMLTSPYCDAPRFALQFGNMLRELWRRWCTNS